MAPFPKKYVNSTAFIAEHGSPSSPAKPGFRVAAVTLTSNGTEANATAHINFISGWLSGGIPWGGQLQEPTLAVCSIVFFFTGC